MKRRPAAIVQTPAPLTQAPAPHMMFRPSPTALSETSRSTYRDEKAKAVRERALPHAEIMADAKRAFEQMIADGKAARHRGRPRKVPLPLLIGSPDRVTAPVVERAGAPAGERERPARGAGKAKPAKARGGKPARKAGKVRPARSTSAPARKKSAPARGRTSPARKKSAPPRGKTSRTARPTSKRGARAAPRRRK